MSARSPCSARGSRSRNFHFVNFSDSPRTGALSPSLLTYLGKRLGDENLLAHARKSYERLDQTGLNLQGQRTRSALFRPAPAQYPGGYQGGPLARARGFLFQGSRRHRRLGRDAQGHLWEFAAKGGNNAEQHNHNDCGSYILNIDGAPVVVEIGAPEYTKDFFRENRYQYLAARTLGHSLPIVNGREQAAGPQYASKVISCELTPGPRRVLRGSRRVLPLRRPLQRTDPQLLTSTSTRVACASRNSSISRFTNHSKLPS